MEIWLGPNNPAGLPLSFCVFVVVTRKPPSSPPQTHPPHFRRIFAGELRTSPSGLPRPPPRLRGTPGMPPPLWLPQFGRAAKGSFGSGGGTSETDAAAAAHCVPSLPPELLAEILARVPQDVAFLFRCALVCKRWRRLLADPAFLRRLLPESGWSSLLGFLVQRHRPNAIALRRITALFKNRAPAFVPAPESALGPRCRFLTSFVRGDAVGLLNGAEPLAERGGLVLLRVFPRAAAGRKTFSLCVCSLLTGKLDALPPLDAAGFDGEGVKGYAVLPAASHGAAATTQRPADGYSNMCQVLLIGLHRGSKQLNIHSFSTAATASQHWGTRSFICLSGDAGSFSGPYGSSVATVCCDTAHWLFQEDSPAGPTLFTVDVSVNTGHVCFNEFNLDVSVESIVARLSLAALSKAQSSGDSDHTGFRARWIIFGHSVCRRKERRCACVLLFEPWLSILA